MGPRLSRAIARASCFAALLAAQPLAPVVAAPPAAGGPSPDDSPERLFAWFDTLGYPDVTRVPLVRVRTNFFNKPAFRYEFLLADGDETFRTLQLTTLAEMEYRKPPAGRPADDGITFEACDLAESLQERIRKSTELLAPDYAKRFGFHEDLVRERTQLLVLARAAQARGLHAEVKKLFDLIARQPPPRWLTDMEAGSPDQPPPAKGRPDKRSLKRQLVDDLAFAETAGAIHLFAFPNTTRRQFLSKLERIVEKFPDFARHAEVADAAARLRRMVREDDEHAARRAKPLESLPRDEQIAERIYRLRDLSDYHYDMTLSYHGAEFEVSEGPVRELANHGLAGVPQLIRALDDDGFIRLNEPHPFSAGEPYAGNFGWPPTVSDVVANALCYIAGRAFEPPVEHGVQPLVQDPVARKKRIQAWYDDVLRRGRKAVLIDGARSGEYYAPDQIFRLAETYPDDSADTIIEIASKARESHLRCAAVACLAKLKGDAVEPFLRKEAEFGPFFTSGVSAAYALAERGVDWGPVMLRRWNHLTAGVVADHPLPTRYHQGPHWLARCLLLAKDAELVRAVSSRWNRLPIAERAETILQVREAFYFIRIAGEKEYDADYVRSLHGLLLTALDDDREQAQGLWDTTRPELFRVADVVGFALQTYDGGKYAFKSDADRPARDAALARIRATLRRDLGLPPQAPETTPPGPRPPTVATQD